MNLGKDNLYHGIHQIAKKKSDFARALFEINKLQLIVFTLTLNRNVANGQIGCVLILCTYKLKRSQTKKTYILENRWDFEWTM